MDEEQRAAVMAKLRKQNRRRKWRPGWAFTLSHVGIAVLAALVVVLGFGVFISIKMDGEYKDCMRAAVVKFVDYDVASAVCGQ